MGYHEGKYRVRVDAAMMTAWGSPSGNEFADLVIEADAVQVDGPEDGYLGLVVRYSGEADFYLFAVSGDGWYVVQRSHADEWADLSVWTETEVVRPRGEVNHLRVECLGATMRFYANGQLLTEVTDSAYDRGNIGLLAGTGNEAGMEAHFDNVKVQVLERF